MPRLSSRTETFTESVIRHMTRVANEHGAINLSQGFPDFDPPKELTDTPFTGRTGWAASVCAHMGCAEFSRGDRRKA